MSINEPQSRNEAILQATLDGTEYTAPPQSRIESLLLQLKAAIEDGGGGGGDTQLAARVAAIEAQLFSTIADVPTNTDSGSMDLYSKDLNTITTSGFYNAMTCTNAPATYCTLVVIGYYLSGYCTQIAADVTTGTLYTRTQTNGTWGSWSAKTNAADLAAVATSGAYSDLSGTPNLADVATSGSYSDLSGTPSLATVATSGRYADLSGKPNLATVATSGAYGDLTGKPTVDTAISSTSTNAVQNKAISAALATKAAAADLTAETTARETADATHAAALADLINGETKNKIDISGLTQQTINGVTWTVDTAKGTVTANGTATANSFFYLWPVGTDQPFDYNTMISGSPEGGTSATHELQAAIGSTVYHDYGSGAEIPAGTIRYIACCVRNGNTVSDLEFSPMLCSKAAWDISPAFVPYYPPLPEMYAMILGQTTGTRSTANLRESGNAGEGAK